MQVRMTDLPGQGDKAAKKYCRLFEGQKELQTRSKLQIAY